MEPKPSDYYLQIQTLTAQTTGSHTVKTSPEAPPNLILPMVTFLLIGIAGLTVIFLLKIRELKHVITIFTIALTAAAIPIGLSLSQKRASVSSQASPSTTPNQLIIYQESPTNFSIEWQTANPVKTVLQYSTDPEFLTDSSVISTDTPVTLHQVALTQLKPDTTYYLRIISETNTYALPTGPIILTTNDP